MDPARGLPRGGVLAEAAADRGQSVAGAVPATAIWSALVHSILLETGLAPGRLELEITEGVLIEDFDRGLALLRRLKALGVRISMDDFGSGYSSLTYLQAFPFDKIKIDRAFVMNLGRNPQSAAIVRAVIGLGHGLDMSIVAEGVETQEQLDFLVAGRLRRGAGLFHRQAAADRALCRAGRRGGARCRRDADDRLTRQGYPAARGAEALTFSDNSVALPPAAVEPIADQCASVRAQADPNAS